MKYKKSNFIAVVLGITLSMQINAMEEQVPEYLYKVIDTSDWDASKSLGHVKTSPIDTQFIHLAKEDQIDGVLNKFWQAKKPLILKLLTKKLSGKLVYEYNPGGSKKYYHLYEGNIPLDAVIEVKCST